MTEQGKAILKRLGKTLLRVGWSGAKWGGVFLYKLGYFVGRTLLELGWWFIVEAFNVDNKHHPYKAWFSDVPVRDSDEERHV